MTIRIPDSWLREFLVTNATTADIQRCLSLCGVSIEKTETHGKEVVYEAEVTTNRIDCFSVFGVAREASAILPEFGYKAHLTPINTQKLSSKSNKSIGITITDKGKFCRRILAIKLDKVNLKPSPAWLQNKLTLVGQRPLNNIIDITNYVMWETGHPIHAFDYDRLTKQKIIVREAKKGESMITLDGKTHTLRGGELVFDDGTGEIIDLPGIMGTKNTVVTDNTTSVLLFIENSDPLHIRQASMGLGIRTQAATINEKDPDPETAYTTIHRAIDLAIDLAGATPSSTLFDYYPDKRKSQSVVLSQTKLESYMGTQLDSKRVMTILQNLGFKVQKDTNEKNTVYDVTPPSWRATDITIPEDIIEEVSRIYGYHNIKTRLPDGEPPVEIPDPQLVWEEEIKIRLRDWGYTEIYSYSMISEEQVDIFGLDKSKAYKISNPLSSDWVYMRPSLWPTMLATIKANLNHRKNLKLFELSMKYTWRSNNLPDEQPILLIAWTGEKFSKAKGLAEIIFDIFGIPFPEHDADQLLDWYNSLYRLALGKYGSVGLVSESLRSKLGINEQITILELDFRLLVAHAKSTKSFNPIPKYPPIVEDIAFTVPERFEVGPLIEALKKAHSLIVDVSLLDIHESTRTLHIIYLDPTKNLTNEDIAPIHEKLIRIAKEQFGAAVKI